MDGQRIDKWLFCVRLAKTRGEAQELCDGGHVILNNDKHFKTSREVRLGDEIVLTRHNIRFHVRVAGFCEKRVSAQIAKALYEYIEDPQSLTPPKEQVFETRREKAGRPTKKDRRLINRLKGRV